MPIPTHSPQGKALTSTKGRLGLAEPVVCSELQGNESAEAAEMTARQRESIIAYLAGIMDADGCLSVFHYRGRNRGRFAIQVFASLKQTQREAIDLLVEHFGGSVYTERPTTRNGATLYRWRRGGVHAERLILALLPHLRLKRRQAEIVLCVQTEIRTNRFRQLGPVQEAAYTAGNRRVRRYMISDESLARRAAWVEEIRRLNDVKGRHRHTLVPK